VKCSCGEEYVGAPGKARSAILCGRCGAVLDVGAPARAVPSGGARPAWIDLRPGTAARAWRVPTYAKASLAVVAMIVVVGVIFPRVAMTREATFSREETSREGRSFGATGLGRLKIMNESAYDTGVWLTDPNASWRSKQILVRQFHDESLGEIGPGVYTLRYCAGVGWDAKAGAFLWTRGCHELSPVVFTEARIGRDTSYNVRVMRVDGERWGR